MGTVLRRAVERHNRMVCFDDGADRFQMRAAGIAIEDRHLLIHRATHEDFWTLPGGRIEQGESSVETLQREMREELLTEVEIGPLSVVLESFFDDIGSHFHEIGFYHTISIPIGFDRRRDAICHAISDGVPIEFRWIPLTAASLDEWRLFPSSLRPLVISLPSTPVHMIDRRGT